MNPNLSGLATAQRRLTVEDVGEERADLDIRTDVATGLTRTPKELPPKYFYDSVGSQLFDEICTTPEYYPTRTEHQLLEEHSEKILAAVGPATLVELGSGAARKTECLLTAAERGRLFLEYVPFDVSESMLRKSAARLLGLYPWLRIRGLVGDYTRHLHHIPRGARRLVLFLGGTIGNFSPEGARRFLSSLRRSLSSQDRLLLGLDLVKDPAILNAAYNDSRGLTAAFNRNVLKVINRELGANFAPHEFEHRAFFETTASQIEMHLVSRRSQRVDIPTLALSVDFEAGESIRTEISRKFSRAGARELLEGSGFRVDEVFTPANDFFALVLARPA